MIQTRQPELEIPSEDPFRNDVLSRDELEPPLTEFVTQASGPLVLALDGAWGSGKTTFLKMWQVKLEEKGHICLYINAWETDFCKEPLIAVVGELSSKIEKFEAEKQGIEFQDQMKKAQQVALSIVKRSIPALIKLATSGILDLKDFPEKVVADLASDIVEDRIKDYENGKSEIEEFRKSLRNLTFEISRLSSDTTSKLIIIIDELDRCRPSYAVELLERIKHLFDVPGIVFVIGINRLQLSHSIRAIYGSGFDANEYLRRFIDLDYRLPDPKPKEYCSHLFAMLNINKLVSKRSINQNHPSTELNDLRYVLSTLMSAANMSLRTQWQIIARLSVILQTIPSTESLFRFALTTMLFLREFSHEKYSLLLEGKIDIDDLIHVICELFNSSEEHISIKIEAILLGFAHELNLASTRLSQYERLLSSDPENPVSIRGKQVCDELRFINNCRSGCKITAKRIEIANNFIIYS